MGVIIGLEGGGTKTGCAVLSEQGTLLAYAEGGPANLNFVSEAVQRESFETALEGALQGIHEPVLALGYTVAGSRANWEWVLQRLGNPVAVAVEEPRMAFVSTGQVYAHGVAVVAGTGSIIAAFVEDQLARVVGGWGSLLGDEGSAYDVAIYALRAAVRAWDGRDPQTKLVEAAMDYFKVNRLDELIPLFYQQGVPRHQVAGFAQKVIQVAERGDRKAQAVVITSAFILAHDAIACARGLFEPEQAFWVAITGGMFRGNTLFRKIFEERFLEEFPRANLCTPVMQPAVAVAKIAWLRTIGNTEQGR
ncbi:MAG: BadF/BadG/BcrA/BcrD ATPase family protein [Armatimonadota bacterium]